MKCFQNGPILGLIRPFSAPESTRDGVTFEEAKAVLLDPYALTREGLDVEGEHRFVTLGMGSKGRLLLAVWTLRDDRIRIISAWKANQIQRRRYEQQF